MDTRAASLALVLLLLAVASGGVLVAEGRAERGQRDRAEEFQRLVGGVGFGPALDLSGCAFGFDPRLDGVCSEDRGPIPGGACFCPRHASSLFFYRPLERRGQPELFPDVGSESLASEASREP